VLFSMGSRGGTIASDGRGPKTLIGGTMRWKGAVKPVATAGGRDPAMGNRVPPPPPARVVLPVFCAVLLAGCGGDSGTGAAAESSPIRYPVPAIDSADPCLTPEERGGAVKFRSDNGAELAGFHLGEGSSGVVLAHMGGGTLCDWIDYGRSLAGRGTAVFVFDLNGAGLSQASADFGTTPRYEADVVAAVETFGERGVESIALVGASLGATAVVVAAAELGDAVTRVAELSGDASQSGMSAVDAATRLEVPLLCIAAEQDFGPATDAQAICDAATSAPSHDVYIAAGTGMHGTALVNGANNPYAPEVQALMDRFLAG
jgi:dienelactone hydrolase